MTIIMSVLSQKGGAGKSTISRLLAVEAARLGKRIKIADLDLTQATSVSWNNRRMQAKRQPAVEAQTFGAVAQALRDAASFDLMVIDGAPSASRAALEAAKASVLTIIPTRPSLDDLRPALAFARDLERNGIAPDRIVFVLNQTTDSQAEINDARASLEKAGFPMAEAVIPYKTGYSRALDDGAAPSEARHPALQGKAQTVASELFAYLRTLEGAETW